jgi:hypothetical protein
MRALVKTTFNGIVSYTLDGESIELTDEAFEELAAEEDMMVQTNNISGSSGIKFRTGVVTKDGGFTGLVIDEL